MADPCTPTCRPSVRCVLMWSFGDGVAHVMTDLTCVCVGCLCLVVCALCAAALPAFCSPPGPVLFCRDAVSPQISGGEGDLVVCARSRDGESVARETASHGFYVMRSR